MVLGALGFWGLPILLDNLVPYNQEIFGATVFFFMFWIFINVHHYFLDNVMWRATKSRCRQIPIRATLSVPEPDFRSP